MNPMVILDVALAGLTLGLVIAALWTRQRAAMIVLFIGAGGVVSLIWVRLLAPDVALAEAAIGAALTGGLMLRAQASIAVPAREVRASPAIRLTAALVSVALFGGLAWVFLSLDWNGRTGLEGQVFARLGESGVTNPVTAVLLNFRGYDTLLEVAVFFVAVLVVWAVAPRPPELPVIGQEPVFLALVRPFVPLLCVISGYLLWLGGFAPGGAFQAGAAACAALLLLLLTGEPGAPGRTESPGLRLVLAAGLLVFIAVAAAVTVNGLSLLEYPRQAAKYLILLIEATLTFSIALTLVALFIGGRPPIPQGSSQ